jgi:hypothetical protein
MKREQTEIEVAVQKRLTEMFQEDPTKLFMFMLVKIGETMVDTNADTFDLSSEMTIEGNRYKVKCTSKIKKISKSVTPSNG